MNGLQEVLYQMILQNREVTKNLSDARIANITSRIHTASQGMEIVMDDAILFQASMITFSVLKGNGGLAHEVPMQRMHRPDADMPRDL